MSYTDSDQANEERDMTDDDITSSGGDSSPTDPKAPRRKRGTGFPVVSLSDAARIVKEAGKYGFEHPTPAFASYMGHSTTNSGAFRQRLSAFRDWELVTGGGDMLIMTDVARMIAMPTDTEAERKAMQQAFMNCEVFARLYERTAKGQPLNPDRLGGRAVHEFGVSPGKASKFIESFVDSAVAAELAEVDDQGDVVLWGPANDVAPSAPPGEEPIAATPTPPPAAPVASRAGPATSAPTVRQRWPIAAGEILFELRSDNALPASAFSAIGEVVSKLEALAATLAPPAAEGPDEDVET